MLLRFFLSMFLIKLSMSATNDELKEELRLVRQDIVLLKVENKDQSDQITRLKNTVESQSKIFDQKIVQEVNKKLKNCAITGDENSSQEKPIFQITPFVFDSGTTSANCRLLTMTVYDGVFQSKTLPESSTTTSPARFYGPPTSCSDLSLLGYTLNGFYQVKSEGFANIVGINNDTKLDTVFCAFKQPEMNQNPSLVVENRIISRRDTNKIVFHVERGTDLELNPLNPYITFDVERVNLGDAFNVKSGIYTVPKSGLYLLFFKGMIIFPKAREENSANMNDIFINLVRTNPYESIGVEMVNTKKDSYYIEFGKLVRGNRGDTITISMMSSRLGSKFSSRNTSFTGYLYEE